MEKACFDQKETAKYLGLGITQTQHYMRNGFIPSIKLGRRYIIPKATLDKWLEEQSLSRKVFEEIEDNENIDTCNRYVDEFEEF